MQKYIELYLKVTGVTAALALLFPGLVVVGFYLLILPGLILSIAPTAFLWGCVFAAIWSVVQSRLGDTVPTALIAAALTATLLFAITQPFRTAGQDLYRKSLLPDITPSNRLSMTGDIRIDLPLPRWDNLNPRETRKQRGFACDNLCLALLFTPGVKSVTINKSSHSIEPDHQKRPVELDPEARTYWLVPKAQCNEKGLQADLAGRAGLFFTTPEEGRALVAEWKAKLENDFCLRRSSPLGRHDMLIRHRSQRAPTRFEKRWSITARIFHREEIELHNASGDVLFRRSKIDVFIPSRFLTISFEGGPDSMRPGWSGGYLTNKPRFEADIINVLEQHTNTAGR